MRYLQCSSRPPVVVYFSNAVGRFPADVLTRRRRSGGPADGAQLSPSQMLLGGKVNGSHSSGDDHGGAVVLCYVACSLNVVSGAAPLRASVCCVWM